MLFDPLLGSTGCQKQRTPSCLRDRTKGKLLGANCRVSRKHRIRIRLYLDPSSEPLSARPFSHRKPPARVLARTSRFSARTFRALELGPVRPPRSCRITPSSSAAGSGLTTRAAHTDPCRTPGAGRSFRYNNLKVTRRTTPSAFDWKTIATGQTGTGSSNRAPSAAACWPTASARPRPRSAYSSRGTSVPASAPRRRTASSRMSTTRSVSDPRSCLAHSHSRSCSLAGIRI
jgi:hypothetical protein